MTRFLLAASLLALAACDSDSTEPEDVDTGTDTDDMMDAQTVPLSVSFTNLAPLGAELRYEGWLIVDETPVSTGVFNAETGVSNYTFDVASHDADAATAFVLTLEPTDDPDPAPAATKLLGGAFTDGTADLTVAHPAALNDAFDDIGGDFILATPTSAATDDETQGIWWLDPSGPSATLDLPELPDGWVYEGWVAGPDGPVSTGTFSVVDEADDDGPGATAGDQDAPPFPGQDFISPAVDLVGLTAVISIEPQPDDGPAPFALKPLVGPIDSGTHSLQPMDSNLDSFVTGTATF